MPKLTPEQLEAKADAWQAHVDRLFAARDAERSQEAAASFAAHRDANASEHADGRLQAIRIGIARRQEIERRNACG